MAPIPTELDVDGDVDLDVVLGLPTDPTCPIPERHRKIFIEDFKDAEDAEERELIVKKEIRLRKSLFAETREWEKSRSTPINDEEKGKASQEEDEDEDLENNPQKKLKICTNPGFKTMDYYMRCNRSYDAYRITEFYKFVKGRKICISYTNLNNAKYIRLQAGHTTDRCFDTTWIAVHGAETICMVTHRELDMTCFPSFYLTKDKEKAMEDFARAIISEVECIPYDDFDYNEDELRQCLSKFVQKPFCVVSEVLHSGKDSSYDADLAVEFLQSKVSSGLALTDYETIQTAIGAYQRMHKQKFRAEDIWVTSFHFGSCYSEHLHIDQRREQLAIVNGLSSAEAPMKWPLFWLRRLNPKSDVTPVCSRIFNKDMNFVIKKYSLPSINWE